MAEAARTVLVTGGSSGIGLAVVRRFLEAGVRVTVLDRAAPPEAGAELVTGDVRRYADQVRAVEADAPSGSLDVLVANAGVHDGGLGLEARPEELERVFRSVIEVNVLGYLLAARAGASALRVARGVLLLTLSDAAFTVHGNGSGLAYATSKHAGVGLLHALARDLAPEVRVNAVAPGGVATSLESVTTPSVHGRPILPQPEVLARSLADRTMLERGVSLSEVAASFFFLASSGAGGITGQVLRVDAGLT